MAPAKLKRHLHTKHPSLIGKNYEYFEQLLKSHASQKQTFNKVFTLSHKAQIASFKLAELIVKNLKPHTIAETLIMPACSEIVQILFGDKAKDEVMKIPHSNNTIKNRILLKSKDIENTVCQMLKTKNFTLQLDESTDSTGKAHLIGFIRFVKEQQIANQFLFYLELKSFSTGAEIYNAVSTYLGKNDISWANCKGICTDGAPAMVGSVKGFIAFVKCQNPNIITTHCFLHRESLVAKTLPLALKSVLDQVVTMVNYIKSRPLKTRLFKNICSSMEAQYESLLLHTEVRWLSRGKVLNRILELKEELIVFFQNEENNVFSDLLTNKSWCTKLSYLNEIFEKLNNLNSSMQGRNENILSSTDKLLAFKKTLNLWTVYILEQRALPMFPSLKSADYEEMAPIIINHLDILKEKLDKYFPSLEIESYDWIRNPFNANDNSRYNFSLSEEEEFINLISDRSNRLKFLEMNVEEFWISIGKQFNNISKKAIMILLQFSTSYLCELGFSMLANIITKKREKLVNVEEELRVAISSIRPDIEKICKDLTPQTSH
ncbi:zinc finger BED domain-containing protein 5/7/8/9 [Enteropsectra breve]|nr:zinc finger BED domain-containing protein 5/7/8/9 [Enteropsectra breve]